MPIEDPVRVEYATFSMLEAELQALLRAKREGHKWMYLINLTKQEFSLRTNIELVKILKNLNGANLIVADTMSNRIE